MTTNCVQKPNLSFVAMITMAIQNSERKMCRLADIYKYINEKFPYYSLSNRKWQNSIRHSLSFNDCFVRLKNKDAPKSILSEISDSNSNSSSTSRGDYWVLHDDADKMFDQGGYLRRHKKFIDPLKPKKRYSLESSSCEFLDSPFMDMYDTENKENIPPNVNYEYFQPLEPFIYGQTNIENIQGFERIDSDVPFPYNLECHYKIPISDSNNHNQISSAQRKSSFYRRPFSEYNN